MTNECSKHINVRYQINVGNIRKWIIAVLSLPTKGRIANNIVKESPWAPVVHLRNIHGIICE